MEKKNIVSNRHDFAVIVEVRNSNPNGDSIADNPARQDPQTGIGLISADCTRHKIRRAAQIIYPDISLLVDTGSGGGEPAKIVDGAGEMSVIDYVREKYWDARTFGAGFSNCEKSIKGSVQIGIGHSVSPVEINQVSMTRKAIATTEKFSDDGANTMFGNKQNVAYGVYVIHGNVNPLLAEKAGFTEDDMEVFFQCLIHMYDFDKAAGRCEVNVRRVIDFVHSDPCPNQRPQELYDALRIEPVPEVQDGIRPPRCFDDYTITIDAEKVRTEKIIIRELV